MPSASCTYPNPLTLPNPPTTAQACAVPIGGSNSTLLDTCCNGHINPVKTYSAPGSKGDCYLYCTTDDVVSVQECLAEYMMAGAFQCFGVKERPVEGSGGRLDVGKSGWMVKLVMGLGILGSLGGLV